jgi:hypothetical protein
VARTQTPGLDGDDLSYEGRFAYIGDRYGVQVEHLLIGSHFNPEVGFLLRDDVRRSLGVLRYSPRPRGIRGIRRFLWEGSVEYVENGAGSLETRHQRLRFLTEFESSDQFSIEGNSSYELLVRPFEVARNVTIPAGGYSFADVLASYTLGAQRRASGTFSIQRGNFYNGEITTLGYRTGRVEVTPHLSVEPSFLFNWIDVPARAFRSGVLRSRVDYAFTARMFASALLQYNSSERTYSNNLRLRWEYQPGSEFFVVYTDERSTIGRGFPFLQNRAFVVKLTRLLRF